MVACGAGRGNNDKDEGGGGGVSKPENAVGGYSGDAKDSSNGSRN